MVDEPKCFIYALLDPRSQEWRYIGLSSVGIKRPRSHWAPNNLKKDRTYKAKWVRQLVSLGLEPEILVLETLSAPEGLQDAERAWIAAARRIGVRLTNSTDGGDGLVNPTQHVRDKMRAWVRSDELRARLSAAHKGYVHPPEARAKLSAALKGRKKTPEHVAKVRLGSLGLKRSEETKARLRASHTTPEYLAKVRRSNNGRWLSWGDITTTTPNDKGGVVYSQGTCSHG